MKPYFAIFALSMFSLNAHAGLNKWVDADGTVHYSDTVPPEVTTAESVRNIAGKGQTNASASSSPKSFAEREAEMKKNKQSKEEAAQKQARQETDAEARSRNCEAARQNVRNLEEGTRIVTYDTNGERSYLDDSAREQRLEEARKAVSTNCN
jgi:Domain of unknown function (DUF4124)